MMQENSELISETDGIQDILKRIQRCSKERCKDIKPRNFPLRTMKNLPQFRNKSHEEVRQYMLEKKGVDIGGNFNWNGFAIVMLILIAVLVGGYGVWKWYNRKKHEHYYRG